MQRRTMRYIGHRKQVVEEYNQPLRLNGDMDLGRLFKGGEGSQYFEGDVAEVLIYDRVLDPAHQLLVQAYLAERYRLPLAPPRTLGTLHVLPDEEGFRVELRFAVEPGWEYRVFHRDALLPAGPWQLLPHGPHSSGVAVDQPMGDTPRRYYRIETRYDKKSLFPLGR